jgi:polyhydroxyalkanoate synthase
MQASWNLTKHVLGVDRAKTAQSPRDEVYSDGKATLWHYRSDQVTLNPPVLLIPSLVSRAFILDLQPGNSLVEHLIGRGFDVYMMDWGEPNEADANNTLETYTHDMLPRAVRAIDEMHDGSGVSLFGYCFGGILTLLYAASHPHDPVTNLVQLAPPVAFTEMPPAMMIAGGEGVEPDHVIDVTGNVPASSVRGSFSLLTPTADLATVAGFFEKLHDEQFLSNYQAMTSWTRDHVPFPGGVFRQTVELFQQQNAIANNLVVLNGEPVDLADINVPFLNILGDKDHIVPPASSEGLDKLVGSSDATELRLPAGHVGMIIGPTAMRKHMPAFSDWIVERSI